MLARARSARERAIGSMLFSRTVCTLCTKMSVLKTRISCEWHRLMTLTTTNLPACAQPGVRGRGMHGHPSPWE